TPAGVAPPGPPCEFTPGTAVGSTSRPVLRGPRISPLPSPHHAFLGLGSRSVCGVQTAPPPGHRWTPPAFGPAWGVPQVRAVLAGYLGRRSFRGLWRVRRGEANDLHCPPTVIISVAVSPVLRLNPDSEPMTYWGATDVRVRATATDVRVRATALD